MSARARPVDVMGNVFDDVAALADKYGKAYESAVAAGNLEKAETFRAITRELCEIIINRGSRK